MPTSRRLFIKIAGLAAMGLMAKPILNAASQFRLVEAASPAKPVPIAKRMVMVIDLKACTVNDGCRKCVDACHLAHNVPDIDNPKEEIKWLWIAPYERVFPEKEYELTGSELPGTPVMVLCNHCQEPPCVKVCPTKATWKREDGIVMVDYHRCIGCRYCMAGCPYGARSFNWRDPRPFIKEVNPGFPTRTRGVVEKCNFCEEGLAKNIHPACVEACPEKALVFGDFADKKSAVSEILRTQRVVQRLPELGTHPNVYYIE